jgi:hypothetical protein
MIFLERRRTHLTMAIRLNDELSPENKVIGDVFLKASGIKDGIKHNTGYFLLTNLSEGKYNITTGGKFYRQEDIIVDTKSINPKQPFIDLLLKPNANYPFPEKITILRGKIVDKENKPVPEALIKIKDMAESAISEEDGVFFIQFNAIDAEKKIVVNIIKSGYKAKSVTVHLKNDVTTWVDPINLNKTYLSHN